MSDRSRGKTAAPGETCTMLVGYADGTKRACGQIHVCSQFPTAPCCASHIRGGERRGQPCTKAAEQHLSVCSQHGARGGNARNAKARRQAEVEARKAADDLAKQAEAAAKLRGFGSRVDVDPAEELLDVICHTAGRVRFIRTRVDELDRADLAWGVTKEKVGGDDYGTTRESRPNVWIAMLDHWTDKLAKLCIEALRIGLDERRVRIAEKQGEWTVQVLEAVLAELGHDLHDPETAGIVERHLVAVA